MIWTKKDGWINKRNVLLEVCAVLCQVLAIFKRYSISLTSFYLKEMRNQICLTLSNVFQFNLMIMFNGFYFIITKYQFDWKLEEEVEKRKKKHQRKMYTFTSIPNYILCETGSCIFSSWPHVCSMRFGLSSNNNNTKKPFTWLHFILFRSWNACTTHMNWPFLSE